MKAIIILIYLFILSQFVFSQSTTYPSRFVVANDGSGDFRHIQDAIFAVRDLSQQKVTIFIKNGTYQEKVVIPSWKTNISLIGESKDSTIIQFNDFAGKKLNSRDGIMISDSVRTYTSFTVLVQGNDCSIENITIRNSAGRVGQAVALHVEGDRFVAKNCLLLGNQDTLYVATENSRQYYKNCFIEGTTDFIFGEATVIFNNCTIKSLSNSYITAAATRPTQKFGFVFFDCALISDSSVKKVFLGRPWRPFAKTVFIRTNMGSHILKEGWDNWRNKENEKTVFYGEYKNYGLGSLISGRVKWEKFLSKRDMRSYGIKEILSGWKPE
jgi:pectinesterase